MTPPATDRWWPPSLSYSFSSIGRAFFIGRPFPGASLLFCSSSLMPRQDWWEQWEGDRHKSTQRLIEITPRPVSFSSLTESSDFPPFFSFFFSFFLYICICFVFIIQRNRTWFLNESVSHLGSLVTFFGRALWFAFSWFVPHLIEWMAGLGIYWHVGIFRLIGLDAVLFSFLFFLFLFFCLMH